MASSQRPILLIALALALLIHGIFFTLKVSWSPQEKPKRTEVTTVDPRKLEQIRKQWQKERSLLLEKNTDHESSPPEDSPQARYFSSKTRRVEQEQRAQRSTVLPEKGRASDQSSQKLPRKLSLSQLKMPLFSTSTAQRIPQSQNSPQQEAFSPSRNAAADQAIIDTNVPEGSQNLLNTQESVYYSFYARLYQSIAPIWQSRIRSNRPAQGIVPGDYVTFVEVVFDREGTLLAVHRIKGSGIPEFDDAVDSSWKTIQRFPNPPRGLLNESGEVRTGWTFNVHVASSQAFQYFPPSRKY